jgi:hypothetical protein
MYRILDEVGKRQEPQRGDHAQHARQFLFENHRMRRIDQPKEKATARVARDTCWLWQVILTQKMALLARTHMEE